MILMILLRIEAEFRFV